MNAVKESMKGFTEAFFERTGPRNYVAPSTFASRLVARCDRCTYQGPRGEFYIPKPTETPAFDDVCPYCRSTNVEVIDPKFAGIR